MASLSPKATKASEIVFFNECTSLHLWVSGLDLVIWKIYFVEYDCPEKVRNYQLWLLTFFLDNFNTNWDDS